MMTISSNNEAMSDSQPGHPARSPQTRVSPLITLIVGLTIGLLAGYLGRPWLALSPTVPAAATRANPADPSTPAPMNMDSLIAQTRHFRGDANAPVTIIEFGDFQ
jgi:hypothetical protein